MSKGILRTTMAGIPLELKYSQLPAENSRAVAFESPDDTVVAGTTPSENSWSREFALLLSMI